MRFPRLLGRPLRSAALLAPLLGIGLAAGPALAIKGGIATRDPSGIRRSVVQVTGPGGTRCTGTVISRRLVLTAAHCFLAGKGDYRIRALDPRFHFRFAFATQVAIHPDFNVAALGTKEPLNDVALLRSQSDFPPWMVPAPLAARLTGDGDVVDVVAAGFGMSRDRMVSTAGTLREMRFAMLDKIYDPSKLMFLVDRSGKLKQARTGICRGDSGGPVFVATRTGYVQVGIISAVIAGKRSDCGSLTAITAVPAYRDYIEDMASRANTSVDFR